MKDTYYFPHDYHARKDPKVLALISMHGMSAYGVYWSLIEMMHEQGGKIEKFPGLYDGLAYDFRMDKEILTKQIEAMLEATELLLQDEKYIWSDRVLKNIEERKQKHLSRANAGRQGGVKSGETRKARSNASVCLKQNEANEAKERKGKEIKRNNKIYISIAENIRLTEQELERLKTEFGEQLTTKAIKFLSDYKKEKSYKSKDDNLTIRRWVINAVREKEDKERGAYRKPVFNQRDAINKSAADDADEITRRYQEKLAAAAGQSKDVS